jgi:hypothetical protein
MVLIRLLLIVMLTFSASLSAAMEAGHPADVDHDHPVVMSMEDDQPACCEDSTERGQNCHLLPALLPDADGHGTGPAIGKDAIMASGLFLTGFEPSGPLDPPRVM